MEVLGIDVGGSGIKGAPVDVETGALTAGRYRLKTPQPSVPAAVAEVVASVARHFQWEGPIGCTFPAVVRDGVVLTAANVDEAWIGVKGRKLLAKATGQPVLLLNDADAAGLAEVTFGAGRGHRGVIIVLTLGTGIGSAVFSDGQLFPNTELGHLEFRGGEAEAWASDAARKRDKLSWEGWASRVEAYLHHLEFLFSPDLFIVGGGVSRKHAKFLPLLDTRVPVVPAQLRNEAGIVGAALAARILAG